MLFNGKGVLITGEFRIAFRRETTRKPLLDRYSFDQISYYSFHPAFLVDLLVHSSVWYTR